MKRFLFPIFSLGLAIGVSATALFFALQQPETFAQGDPEIPDYRLAGLYYPAFPGTGIRADAILYQQGAATYTIGAAALANTPAADRWLKATSDTGTEWAELPEAADPSDTTPANVATNAAAGTAAAYSRGDHVHVLGHETVSGRSIQGNVVASGHLVNSPIINETRLFPDSVTGEKIPTDTIERGHLRDNVVGTAELVDGEVTEAKLAQAVRDQLGSGGSSGGVDQTARDAAAAAQTTADANTAALSRDRVFGQISINPPGIPGNDFPEFYAVALEERRTGKQFSQIQVSIAGQVIANLLPGGNPDALTPFNQAQLPGLNPAGGVINGTMTTQQRSNAKGAAPPGTQWVKGQIRYSFTDGSPQDIDDFDFAVNNAAHRPGIISIGSRLTLSADGVLSADAQSGGSSGFNPRGAWTTQTAYAVNDVVTYNNHLYYVATAVPASNTTPPSDGTTWVLLSADPTPTATTTRQGTVELATNTEMNAGAANKIPDANLVKFYTDALVTTQTASSTLLTRLLAQITPSQLNADTATEKRAFRALLASSSISTGNTLPTVTNHNVGDVRIITQNVASGLTFYDILAPSTVLTAADAGDVMVILTGRGNVWTRVGNILGTRIPKRFENNVCGPSLRNQSPVSPGNCSTSQATVTLPTGTHTIVITASLETRTNVHKRYQKPILVSSLTAGATAWVIDTGNPANYAANRDLDISLAYNSTTRVLTYHLNTGLSQTTETLSSITAIGEN